MRRVGHNSLAYGYAQAVTLAIQFVQIPLFLKYWGKDMYGEWLVLTGLPMMLVLLDVGVARASESKAIKAAAEGDWTTAKTVIHTAQAYTCCAILMLAPLCLGALFVNWPAVLKIGLISQPFCLFILVCMAVIVAISLQCGVIDARFKVIHRVPFGTFILANRRVVSLVSCAIALIAGMGPPGLAAIWVGVDLVYLCFVEIMCRRLSVSGLHGISGRSMEEFRSIVKPSVAYLAFPAAQALTLQGGVQLLNQFAGPATVVSFTMVRTFVRLIMQIGMVLNNALKPEISRLAGMKDTLAIKKLQIQATLLALGAGLLAFTGVLWLGPWILSLWSGGHTVVSRSYIFLVGLHAILNVAWMVPASVELALNRHAAIAKVLVCASIGALLGWYIFKSMFDPVVGASLLLAIPEAAALAAVILGARTLANARAVHA